MKPQGIVNILTTKVDDVFLPKRYLSSPILLRKARFLTYITLFLVLITLTFEISNAVSEVSGPSLKLALLTGVGLMITFKKFGNFNLSGNLLAMVVFVFQAEAVFITGGLYSDNLLWILAAPLLALLFANYHSGLFWLFSLIGFTVMLYFMEINSEISFREQTYGFDATYFLITYLGLFVIVTGIVLIFATGQSKIIGF